MYGNVGETYVQIKRIDDDGLILNNIGQKYKIQNYYTIPHGYASIKHNGVLMFIPDEMFKECFVTEEKYNRYLKQGDVICVNVNGILRKYEIDSIQVRDQSYFATLELKACD